MTMRRVRARIATTHPIPAYGGFKLHPDSLYVLAQAIRDGTMPMHFNHDQSQPIHPTNIQTGVETLDDGYQAAWMEFDVDADRWAKVEAEMEKAGAPGGFSFSFTEPIIPREGRPPSPVSASAETSEFDDETILRAAQALSPLGESEAERLYQFSSMHTAQVVIEFVSSGVALNILSSVLYDSAKHFLRKGKPSIFNIRVRTKPDGRAELKIQLVTDDDEILRAAIDKMPEIIALATKGTLTYDPDDGEFHSIDSPTEELP